MTNELPRVAQPGSEIARAAQPGPEVARAAQPDPEVARKLGLDGRGRRLGALKRVGAGLVLALAAGGAVQIARVRSAPAAPAYAAEPAKRGDLRVTVTATGTLQALGAVDVGTEVSGRVLKVNATYNDRVSKGQVLAEIDPVQLKAEATQAGAQVSASAAAVRQAEATLAESEQASARAERGLEMGLYSTQELETARATLARSKAAVASAKANATLARANAGSAAWKLEKAKIVSPIDGVVLSRSVEPGQTVAASFQTPVLFKLAADLSRMELHVQVDEADVGHVREGAEAEFRVDAYPGRVFRSRVEALRNEATTSQNVVTYEAVLSVDNAELLLRPGMTATATIVAESRRDVLLVPNAALRFSPPREQRPGGPGFLPGMPRAAASAPAPVAAPAAAAGGAKAQKQVYTLLGGAPKAIAVTAGSTDGSFTEVTGDVAPGTPLLTDMLEGGAR